jgi:hypothetical protein
MSSPFSYGLKARLPLTRAKGKIDVDSMIRRKSETH